MSKTIIKMLRKLREEIQNKKKKLCLKKKGQLKTKEKHLEILSGVAK